MDDLLELGAVPVFYADGCGRIDVFETTVRLTFYEYRVLHGERVKVQVAVIVRPRATFDVQRARILNGLDRQDVPVIQH